MDLDKIRLRQIGRRGIIKIYEVDGISIRQKIDVEFTNFGQHYRFPFIPRNEFWVDKQYAADESKFYIDHLLIEWQLMKDGADYLKALALADSKERAERAKSAKVVTIFDKKGLPHPERVHKQLLGTTNDGVNVWVIDGKAVRTYFFIEFTEGGHDFVYSFVPTNEVWLDDELKPGERVYVLAHELFERGWMKKGLSYDDAHRKASALEWDLRHNIEKVSPEMAELACTKELINSLC